MTMLRIDLTGVADERFSLKIEDVDYFLRVVYLPRTRSFYLSLDDADEAPIHSGVRMVTGYALFASTKDARKQFSGDFFALPFVPGGDSIFDLSAITDGTVKLYYADAETLTAGDAGDVTQALTVTP